MEKVSLYEVMKVISNAMIEAEPKLTEFDSELGDGDCGMGMKTGFTAVLAALEGKDDASADDIMAKLLVLEAQDPERDITLYINSPGGSFTAMTAIYDTMQFIRPEIQTVCLGQAASAAAVLLAAGTPGKRLALPNARVLIHQPALSGQQGGQASDIEIHANEVMRMREWTAQTLALHSGKTYEEVDRSIERDNILTAAAALEYGLVDKVLESRKLRKPATNTAISHT